MGWLPRTYGWVLELRSTEQEEPWPLKQTVISTTGSTSTTEIWLSPSVGLRMGKWLQAIVRRTSQSKTANKSKQNGWSLLSILMSPSLCINPHIDSVCCWCVFTVWRSSHHQALIMMVINDKHLEANNPSCDWNQNIIIIYLHIERRTQLHMNWVFACVWAL